MFVFVVIAFLAFADLFEALQHCVKFFDLNLLIFRAALSKVVSQPTFEFAKTEKKEKRKCAKKNI